MEMTENTGSPEFEAQFVSQLQTIKDKLLAASHGSLLSPEHVSQQWDRVVAIVKELQTLRAEKDRAMDYTDTDVLLEDVAPMFVQFWSENGSVSESMVQIYVDLSRLHEALALLTKTGYFVDTDLVTHKEELLRIDANVAAITQAHHANGESHHKKPTQVRGMSLLKSKLRACGKLLKQLNEELDSIAPELQLVHTRLVQIHRELTSLRRQPPHLFLLSDVGALQDQLTEIDSARIDGAFVSRRDGAIIKGQARVIDVMEECYDIAHELLASRDEVDGENPLRGVYERLIGIKGELEHLMVTRKWMPADKGDNEVRVLQKRLGEIDDLRRDGKFVVEEEREGGGTHEVVPPGQAVLHFLLHKCYRMVRKLQMDDEPLVEELIGIKNQLETLNMCLEQLVKWKVCLDHEELIPYQLKIASIDNMRVDGKFMVNGEVPEGQGILHTLLHECYEKLTELK